MSARIINPNEPDDSKIPCLSPSIAKELVFRSPLHAWQAHRLLGGGKDEEPTEAKDTGNLLHSMLLDANSDDFVVLDVKDYKSGAAKELRDAALAEGKQPVKRADYEELLIVAIELRKKIASFGIVLNGKSEQKIEWTEQIGDSPPVLCRAKLDHYVGPVIYDIKTCRRADLKSIARQIVDLGYDIQGAAYTSALGKLHPEHVGRIDFVDIFCETEKPYAVTPVRFDGALRQRGEILWERAVLAWGWSLKTGKWPAYIEEIIAIEAPPWSLSETSF